MLCEPELPEDPLVAPEPAPPDPLEEPDVASLSAPELDPGPVDPLILPDPLPVEPLDDPEPLLLEAQPNPNSAHTTTAPPMRIGLCGRRRMRLPPLV